MKEKQIQIPYNAFLDVCKLVYLINRDSLDNYTREALERLETHVNGKIERIKKHALYTESKIGATPVERESARQAYLDIAGIKDSFRYSEAYIKNIKELE